MKTISLILLPLLILAPRFSHSGEIIFPGKDKDADGTPFTLSVFTDHITIAGGVPSYLPLQYSQQLDTFVPCGTGTGGCFALTGSSKKSADIAIRNSWIATLLQARTTGQGVVIYWSDTDEHARRYALCEYKGCIYAVGVPSPAPGP